MCDLQPGSSTPHKVQDVALAHPQVRHHTAVVTLSATMFPVRANLDAHLGVGGLEGDLIDQAPARPDACGAVVAFVPHDTPRWFCRADLRQEPGLVTGFDPQPRAG